jgi:hypothetical protein
MKKPGAFKHAKFDARELVEIPLTDEEKRGTTCPLHIGDRVRLIGGSQSLLVVDIEGDKVTVSLPDGDECTCPRVCWVRLD